MCSEAQQRLQQFLKLNLLLQLIFWQNLPRPLKEELNFIGSLEILRTVLKKESDLTSQIQIAPSRSDQERSETDTEARLQ